MATREQSLREERLAKLSDLKNRGLDPYPIDTSDDRKSVAFVLSEFPKGSTGANLAIDKLATIAGRIRSLRLHGKIVFADLEDGSGRMQAILRADDIGEEEFEVFKNHLAEGAVIEVGGILVV